MLMSSGKPSSEVSEATSGCPSTTSETSKRGAAHVDADEVRALQCLRQRDEPHGAADGPGEQRLQRPIARALRGEDAAVRLHHVERHGEAAVAHLVLEPPQVAADDGCRVGVEHRRGGALVLAPLPCDAVRERDGHLAQLLAQDLRRAQLVGRIDVGEEEGDRHGAETLVAHPLRRRPDRRLVERGELLAGVGEATGDLDDVAERDERLGLLVVQVVEAVAVAARDVVDVAGAGRGEQQHTLAAALQEGVQPLRRAVHREVDLGGGVDHLSESREHALREVVGGRGRLAGGVAAALRVVGDDVRERTADVHRDPVRAHPASYSPFRSCLMAPGRRGRALPREPGFELCITPWVKIRSLRRERKRLAELDSRRWTRW